jgi:GT2 family glycosyltransferase
MVLAETSAAGPFDERAMISLMALERISADMPVPSSSVLPVDGQVNQEEGAPEGFDEAAYLEAYPDIAAAVRSGQWASALHHYRVHGERENRLAEKRYILAFTNANTANFPTGSVDRALVSRGGQCLVSGWICDTDDAPMRQILLRQGNEAVGVTTSIARYRRDDAEKAGHAAKPVLAGFWALVGLERSVQIANDIGVTVIAGEGRHTFTVRPSAVDEEGLRDAALQTIIDARYFCDHETETFLQLDKGLGESLIALNLGIVQHISQGACQMRFGIRRTRYLASVVVVLYGEAAYLTLQAALFSQCPDYDQYEFIYVSNSPELSDTLIRDATNASRIYGISITLILLPGNVGFGVANNVAVAAAESDRILFVNPDVLPREPAWPRMHARIVETLPSTQTALFGVPLYFGDGSLMHGGMYFDVHAGCSVQNGRVIRRDILRVEHYGMGAPPRAPRYVSSRPVPAVTGAFISANRAWFERLGGFSPKFIFGHYEDVDLCLRSLQAGTPAWLHDVPFWHLESKGSKRAPLHDGGRLVNRWHLTTKWADVVRAELNGRSPIRFEK